MAQILTAYFEIPVESVLTPVFDSDELFCAKYLDDASITIVPLLTRYFDNTKAYISGNKNIKQVTIKTIFNCGLHQVSVQFSIDDFMSKKSLMTEFLNNNAIKMTKGNSDVAASVKLMSCITPVVGISRRTNTYDYTVISCSAKIILTNGFIINQCLTNRTTVLINTPQFNHHVIDVARTVSIHCIDKSDYLNMTSMLRSISAVDNMLNVSTTIKDHSDSSSSSSDDEFYDDFIDLEIDGTHYAETIKQLCSTDILTTQEPLEHNNPEIPHNTPDEMVSPPILPVIPIEENLTDHQFLTSFYHSLHSMHLKTHCGHEHIKFDCETSLPDGLHVKSKVCSLIDGSLTQDKYITRGVINVSFGRFYGSIITDDISRVIKHKTKEFRKINHNELSPDLFDDLYYLDQPFFISDTTLTVVFTD